MHIYKKIFLFIMALSALMLFHSADAQEATPTLEPAPTPTHPQPTPTDLINLVNNLRVANGLAPLSVHPILMQIAQTEANGIAAGYGGHWRPNNLTLGQWLLSLGYPLSGDLSLDGYRAENWTTASTATAEEAVKGWLSDEEHANTMLSVHRSDIGAGIAVAEDGEMFFVLETALQTSSGMMQHDASAILTDIPQTQIANSNMATQAGENGLLPQYSMPVTVNTAQPDGNVYHMVQYGQTLWNIAINYHTTIKQIQLLNNLTTTTISDGQKLLVVRGATQPIPASNMTGTPTPQTILTAQPPIHFQTSTPQPTEESPQWNQKTNTLSLATIALAALFLGGVFTVITRKK